MSAPACAACGDKEDGPLCNLYSVTLLEPLFPVTKGIRLLGRTLSSLGEKQLESEPQLSLSF
jgi:hypothetical protein